MAKKPFTRIMEGIYIALDKLAHIEGSIVRLSNEIRDLRRRDLEHPLTICFKHVEPWTCRADLRYADEDRREMIAREIADALLKHGLVPIREQAEELGTTYTVELRLWGVDPRITAKFFDRDRVEIRSFRGGRNGI